MPQVKKAMVFAAGLGTRMRPITDKIPKPMVKIKGKPLIDWTLDTLAEGGIEEVIVNTHYKAEIIQEYLKNRVFPKIHFSHEDILLETGGGIINAIKFFENQAFLTVNTDIIFIKKQKNPVLILNEAKKNQATMLLIRTNKAFGYEGSGDFNLLPDGTLTKPETVKNYDFIYSGMQILQPEFLKNPPEKIFSLNYYYKKNLQQNGVFTNMTGVAFDGHWLHVGTPESIKKAENFINSN